MIQIRALTDAELAIGYRCDCGHRCRHKARWMVIAPPVFPAEPTRKIPLCSFHARAWKEPRSA